MIKYVVIGGLVPGPTDGRLHRVRAEHLLTLYGVPAEECILCDDDYEARWNTVGVKMEWMTVLRPRHDGDYRLPGRRDKRSA